MKINSASDIRGRVNFKSANVNILATSDNHGNVHSLPKFVKTIESNKDEIFNKGQKENTLNVFAIAGDWFINPSKKGFITKSEMTNGDIQLGFLKKVITLVKQASGGDKSNFKTHKKSLLNTNIKISSFKNYNTPILTSCQVKS